MKKLTCCLLTLAIIFSFAFSGAAWAEDLVQPVHYDIESEQGVIGLDIDEPLWIFVTRDNISEKLDSEDEVQGWLDYMTENSIIAEGSIVYENTDTTLDLHFYQFALSPEEAVDFKNLSETEIEEFKSLINEDLQASGYEVVRSAEMGSSANQIMLVGYEYSSEGYYARDYVTCLGNVMYQLRFECTEPFVVEEYEQIEKIVDSLSFTPAVADVEQAGAEPERSFQMPTALDVLISFAITIAVYSLPIIIYRYVIRKAPVEEKKAKKITIIYGIVGFVVMSAILIAIGANKLAGSAVIIWSYVNYRMLTN